MHSYGMVPRNTFILYGTHILTALISLVFYGVLARYLGVLDFGIFSYVYAFMTVAQTAGAFGLDMLMIREIAADKTKAMEITRNTIILKFIFASAALLFSLLFIYFTGMAPLTKKILFLFSPYILLSNINLTFWYIGDGYQRMEYRGIFTVAYYICRTIGGWLVLKYTAGITELFVFLLATEFIFLLISAVFVRRHFGIIIFRFERSVLMRFVRIAFPFAVNSIILIFLLRLDILLLNALQGETAVGFYSPAQKLLSIILLFSSAFCSSAYPAMSQSSKITGDKGYSLFIKTVKLIFMTGVLFAVLTTLIAEPAVRIIFGSEYIVSARVLKLLIWMCPPFFAASLLWVLFGVRNFQHWVTIIFSLGTFVSFGLNFYLVKKMSYFGSALAMVIFSLFLLMLSFAIYYGNRKKLFNLQ